MKREVSVKWRLRVLERHCGRVADTIRTDLERSTLMFSQLADPNGHNNPLSQVLYGLALR
jgi:hypothetical protein